MRILELQRFIDEHADWEALLQQKPYCISISRDTVFDRDLVIFKYSQIDSDFKLSLVRECRGLILDARSFDVVCYPFQKFGNYGESYCPQIDWSSSYCTEKIDGSLIKVVRLGNDLLVSTNGTIDAYKAPLQEQIGCIAKSFGDLFDQALVKQCVADCMANGLCLDVADPIAYAKRWLMSQLDENVTYMFELTSPFNKVVVSWHDVNLHFIGVRDNISGHEQLFSSHKLAKLFDVPKVYQLHSLQECINAAAQLGPDAEGYVVLDKHFNRIKVKSVLYCSLHHMKNNGIFSYERAVEVVQTNELGEVLTYFPEFAEHLNGVKGKMDALAAQLEHAWNSFSSYSDSLVTRKDKALAIQKEFGPKLSGIGFALLDKKTSDIQSWLRNSPASKIVQLLGLKDKAG